MRVSQEQKKFESLVMPHMNAAYNLARWMMGDDSEAQDAVQNAALRAFKYLATLKGNEAKAWFLGIVRNCCLTRLRERSHRLADVDVSFILNGQEEMDILGASSTTPDTALLNKASREAVNTVLRQLPVAHREILILREMEDMAYEDIAEILGVPMGTVMSRLSRARLNFRQAFLAADEGEKP